MSRAFVEELVKSNPVENVTPDTITNPEEILWKVEETRRLGWAVSDGELTSGGVALAVPIQVAHREPAALSFYIPKSRLADGDLHSYARKLQAATTFIRPAVSITARGE